MRFASLGSGSKGNATLVEYQQTCLLVDCGFSAVETERRLSTLGKKASDIDAILVTHEHSDHIKGVGVLARKHELPVYLTAGTHRNSKKVDGAELEMINVHQSFDIGGIEILPVPVPHDAMEPSQFIFSAEGRQLGLLTDLGNVSAHVASEYRSCDALLLECNHDLDLLARGPYPSSLKRRVGGAWGHLNNRQAAEFLRSGGLESLKQLVVAHISDTNNTIECVKEALAEAIQGVDHVEYAQQDSGFDWIELSGKKGE